MNMNIDWVVVGIAAVFLCGVVGLWSMLSKMKCNVDVAVEKALVVYLQQITPDNLHCEVNTGDPVGLEGER